MPRAVAEVAGPRERGVDAVGVVRQARQKTPDAAEAHAEDEWEHVNVARRVRYVQPPLRDLHTDPPAEQSADDRFAAKQCTQVRAIPPVMERRLEPRQQFRADERTEHAPDDEPEVRLQRHGCARPAATEEE